MENNFSLAKSISILEKTPAVIDVMLRGLHDEWIYSNEGGETWSPFVVVGHLIHGEQTDWIERLEIILSDKVEKRFTPFDRFAQFRESDGKSLVQLLDRFAQLRKKNLEILKAKNITDADLGRKGMHPALGEVNLQNLLSTWVVHDLNHIAQIVRIMSYQY